MNLEKEKAKMNVKHVNSALLDDFLNIVKDNPSFSSNLAYNIEIREMIVADTLYLYPKRIDKSAGHGWGINN